MVLLIIIITGTFLNKLICVSSEYRGFTPVLLYTFSCSIVFFCAFVCLMFVLCICVVFVLYLCFCAGYIIDTFAVRPARK
jgi:hypothetical protein